MNKIFAGIDSGSRTTKLVMLREQEIIYKAINLTGIDPPETAAVMFQKACRLIDTGTDQVEKLYATGYGRNNIPQADRKISEISCHARGIGFIFPQVKTIIDIGGQDSKIIIRTESDKVTDFVMNDKCAAGTGRFLEVVATNLGISVNDLGRLAAISTRDIKIDSTCVVFAESEIISHLGRQEKPENIIAAVHRSIAVRLANMAAGVNWDNPVAFTGGVARNTGMKAALENVFSTKILVPEEPEFTGALGAALFASLDQ
ncbi:MAG: 2-hydroxyglutaryl-CoA dehydratase [Candidatus Cloacimonetes bacterium]|nr:2-hydroxyglutaryl-CoA dehydratase [Candidatus Cloacimonadota bacterium]